LTTHINQETTIWVGDPDIQQEFERLFFKHCSVDASELCLASEQERIELVILRARARGLHPPADIKNVRLRDIELQHVLCPGDMRRKLEYEKLRNVKQSTSGTFFAEIGQELLCGGDAAPEMPTFCSQGDIMNFRDGCLVTGRERFAFLGIPVYAETSHDFDCPILVDKLTETARQMLTGNGMHLHAMMCCFLYVMSSVVRKDDFESLPMMVRGRVPDSDSDKEGEPTELVRKIRKRPAASSSRLTFCSSNAGVVEIVE
jgi:hypothetical protein